MLGKGEFKSCKISGPGMNAEDGQLDQLAETIGRLRLRIEQHRQHIGGHETRTRVILIDPLLRSLGWDTEDPEVVVHEKRVGNLVVDYALIDRGEVFGLVEAKSLGSKLNDEDWGKYAEQLPGVPVIALTNGNEWRFFPKSNARQREIKIVSNGERFQTWYEINQRIGRAALVDTDDAISGALLPDLLAQMLAGEFPKGIKPTRISFDGLPIVLPKRTWKQMYATVASHLVATGRIKANTTIRPEGKKDGKPLLSPSKDGFHAPMDIGRGLWLEANVAAKGAVANSIFLLEWCGIDPTTVRVHFD